jgi:hypothetical protein
MCSDKEVIGTLVKHRSEGDATKERDIGSLGSRVTP